jgi:hypothetical protein
MGSETPLIYFHKDLAKIQLCLQQRGFCMAALVHHGPRPLMSNKRRLRQR